jgi:recombination protein RecT
MATPETLAPEKPSPTAPEKPESSNPTVRVGNRVRQCLEKGTLQLPADYSAENALKSAWLKLQTVENKEGKLALTVCTSSSIEDALFSMVVQGLNPDKNQCYFIAYGPKLTMQRSYYGDQALAKRVLPGVEIYSDVVYEGDEFTMEKIRGRTVILRHTSSLANQDPAKVIAAYCGIIDTKTGEDLGADVMTMAEIKRSWGMSKTYNPNGNGVHNKFPDRMALRTVTRRRCNPIIYLSNDALLMEQVRKMEDDSMLAEFNEEVANHANRETLSLPLPSETVAIPPAAAPVAEPVPVPAEPAEDKPPY